MWQTQPEAAPFVSHPFGEGAVIIRRFRRLGTKVDNTKGVNRIVEFSIRIIRMSISKVISS